MNRDDFGKRPRLSRAVIEDDEPNRRHLWSKVGGVLAVLVLALIAGWLVLG